MKDFEKHIRRRVKWHRTAMDTDALWASMQADVARENRRRRRRRFLLFFLLPLLVLSGIASLFWVGLADKQAGLSETESESSSGHLPLCWEPNAETQRDGICIPIPTLDCEIATLPLARGPISTKRLAGIAGKAKTTPKPQSPERPAPIAPLQNTLALVDMPEAKEEIPLPEIKAAEAVAESEKHHPNRRLEFSLGTAVTRSQLSAKDESMDYYARQRALSETPQFTFSADFAWSQRLRGAWWLRSGLSYTQVRQQVRQHQRLGDYNAQLSPIQGNNSLTAELADAQSTYKPASVPPSTTIARHQNIELRQSYHFLDIPLGIAYLHEGASVSLLFEGGGFYNLQTWYGGKMLDADIRTLRPLSSGPEGFRRSHGMGFYGRTAVLFPLARAWQCQVGLHLRHSHMPISGSENPLRQRMVSSGVSLGVSRSF